MSLGMHDGAGTFVVPAVTSPTVRALSEVAVSRGFRVVPLTRTHEPAELPSVGPVHLFGGPRLAAYEQQQAPLALLEPPDGWLAQLPARFLRRQVRLMPALQAYGLQDQWFVKMQREKGLEPGAYGGWELPTLPEDEPPLVSELVTMGDEWRFWVLDGAVRTGSSYRRSGRPDARPFDQAGSTSLHDFVDDLLADQATALPSAVVLDVAWVERPDPGWAVFEANMAWFASHYAGDPDRVLDVVVRAAGPVDTVSERDRAFCTRGPIDRSGSGRRRA